MFSFIDLNDPQIWVAVSFVLFFLIFGNFIWKKLLSFLDNKINSINEEIETAASLHQEAKKLLSEEMRKFQGLDNELKAITEEGKLKAQNLYNESKDKVNKEIEKMEKSALEKISYLENQAVKQIEDKLSRNAIKLTERFLENKLNQANHAEIINNSIKELETTLTKTDKFIQ